MKESWLDPVTEKDVENYLNDRYTANLYGVETNHLLNYKIYFIYDNGKKAGVNAQLIVQDDWDVDEKIINFNEYCSSETNLETIFYFSNWAEMIRTKNEGRKINGKTYDEARLDFIEELANEYYANEHKKIDVQKSDCLKTIKARRKTLLKELEKKGEKNKS